MDLGVQWLGFVIPIAITTRMSVYFSRPGTGVCVECEQKRARVFIRGDGLPYCDQCIEFDLAEADPSDEIKLEQPHPQPVPVEIRYDKIKLVINDGLDLRVYERVFS